MKFVIKVTKEIIAAGERRSKIKSPLALAACQTFGVPMGRVTLTYFKDPQFVGVDLEMRVKGTNCTFVCDMPAWVVAKSDQYDKTGKMEPFEVELCFN